MRSLLRIFGTALTGVLLLSSPAQGQDEFTVSGTVTDAETGETLPGVNVAVLGASVGTASSAEGTFTLEVPSSQDTLSFSYVGYAPQEVPINGRSELDVTLSPATVQGEEVVVVGYGTQQRRDLTGSVSVVEVESMARSNQTSIAGALEGQVPGVSVQTSGAPGEEPAINIRGIGTLGQNEPLYVVDGVPVENIVDFNLNNVESMQVMKDAAAAAIYGSRAANGVVIIETEQGQEGLRINYNGVFGTENLHQRIDMLERPEFQELINIQRRNAGQPLAPGNDPDSPAFVDDVNTNWQDEAYERAFSTEHNLTVSGGNDVSTYSVSGTFSDSEGHMQGPAPSFRSYNARINSSHTIGILTVGENLALTRSEDRPQTPLQTQPWSLVNETLQAAPTVPIYDESRLGGYGGPSGNVQEGITLNTVGSNNLVDRQQRVNRVLGNLWGELQILDDLTYRLNVSYDTRMLNERYFIPTYDLGFYFNEQRGELNVTENDLVNTTIQNTVTYYPTFGSHNLEIVGGYSEERRSFEQTYAQARDYSRPFFKVIDAGQSNRSSGYETNSNLRSFFGRVQYDYDGRYLLTATLRRDGSSRFGDANQYGNFPSVSLGWRLSDEPFFDVSWVEDLKLRGSWGQLGRQNIADYATSAFINTNDAYTFNNTVAPAAIQVSLVNPDIKWETLVSRTIGVDASLLGNTLDLTAEYFNNESRDILIGTPLPMSLGSAEDPIANAASIRNTGFEFMAEYNNTLGDLEYNVGANLSTLANEVLSLGDNGEPIFGAASKTEVGSEIGEIFGYVTDGIFQSQEEIDDHATQQPGTAPGDIRFADLNGDGVIDPDNDRTYLGSPTPDFTYGFRMGLRYGQWDASLFMQGNYGNKIFNEQRRVVEDLGDFNNQSVRAYENRWTPDDPHGDARFPRAVWGDPNTNNRDSDRWVEDGSYLRMQNLTVGYELPEGLIGRAGIDRLRVYVAAQNLFTVTGYSGLDPEISTGGGAGLSNVTNDGLFSRGFDDGSWPHPRRFETGVQLTF